LGGETTGAGTGLARGIAHASRSSCSSRRAPCPPSIPLFTDPRGVVVVVVVAVGATMCPPTTARLSPPPPPTETLEDWERGRGVPTEVTTSPSLSSLSLLSEVEVAPEHAERPHSAAGVLETAAELGTAVGNACEACRQSENSRLPATWSLGVARSHTHTTVSAGSLQPPLEQSAQKQQRQAFVSELPTHTHTRTRHLCWRQPGKLRASLASLYNHRAEKVLEAHQTAGRRLTVLYNKPANMPLVKQTLRRGERRKGDLFECHRLLPQSCLPHIPPSRRASCPGIHPPASTLLPAPLA
jgi:hypothetical protein